MEWLSVSDVGLKKFTSAGKREGDFHMSDFETDFPTLYKRFMDVPRPQNIFHISREDVEICCLDKQKVNEKIMRLPNCDIRKYLLKEMGLC
jgi:hypothetical protein